MFINIGSGEVADTNEIIGIFDLDITSQSYITREFLKKSEENGLVINKSDDIPKTFIVTDKVLLCQPSAATLYKRTEEINH